MKEGNDMKNTIRPELPHPASSRFKRPLILASLSLLLFAGQLMASVDDSTQAFLPPSVQDPSTVPPNGDLNPYGVAFVPPQFPTGTVNPGDVLVSNFNNNQNLQGTGTTIVRITPTGTSSVFFQGQAPLGLSTALNITKRGFVFVGNFPSSDGTCGNSQPGSILIINSSGMQVGSISGSSIDGPWDSTLFDQGGTASLFVSNALNGTVVRFNLKLGAGGVSVVSTTQIASGYLHQCDPVTFVDGPTGLVYNPIGDVLYVASTEDNAVFSVSNASTTTQDDGRGTTIYEDPAHLHGALAMAMAPNGHLLVSNNDAINPDPNQPSEIVEFTIQGRFVKELEVDPNPGGAFGLAVAVSGKTARFADVDDVTNTLYIWTLPPE
jgi:hypothetical protein